MSGLRQLYRSVLKEHADALRDVREAHGELSREVEGWRGERLGLTEEIFQGLASLWWRFVRVRPQRRRLWNVLGRPLFRLSRGRLASPELGKPLRSRPSLRRPADPRLEAMLRRWRRSRRQLLARLRRLPVRSGPALRLRLRTLRLWLQIPLARFRS